MATYCEVTGRRPGFGRSVSHSHRRTPRRFDPNLQTKRFYLRSENRWVRLTVSTKGIKTIDTQGIEAVVARLRRRAERLMARANDVRPVVRLKSTAGTGYTYVTRKNRRNDPDRLVLRKYDPRIRRHVEFREER
jgi:large subunit ribosomal protein L28